MSNCYSKKLGVDHVPTDENGIEQQILDIAKKLIYDHAGRRTISRVTTRLPNSFDYKPRIDKKIIPTGSSASGRSDWQTLLEQEQQRLSDAGKKLQESAIIGEMLTIFEEQIGFFETQVSSIEAIRQEFSGKRILQFLVSQWGVTGGKGNKTPWQLLCDDLINSATGYSKNIPQNDERLKDFRLLADKIVK